MSSKLSPKKDEKVTPTSPNKKDSKSAKPAIMTRHKAIVMNTRQLRNQDASRKKISAITQMLLSPNKDKSKTTTFNKRRSPKDKKNKTKESPKKHETVKVTQLVLETKKEPKTYSRKRKTVAEPKDVPPAKSSKQSPALSVQELIDLCEEQSLDDEDFLEILTCESPVWWEQPDNMYYCEDAIATTAEQKRHFQQFFKSQAHVKTEPVGTSDNTKIKIPEVKQTDDKFMKKRNKLEKLLGNIKNKLTDTPKVEEKVREQVIEQNIHSSEKTQINEQTDKDISSEVKNDDEKTTKDETELKRAREVKSPSESTSSSDDMFFGFQNDDILNDLENMEIPVKENEPYKENSESIDTCQVDNKEVKDSNSKDNNEIEDENSEEEIKTASAKSTDQIIDTENPAPNTILEVNKQAAYESKDSCNLEAIKPKAASVDKITCKISKNVHPGIRNILEKGLSSSSETKETCNSIEAKTSDTKESTATITNSSSKTVLSENSSSNSQTTTDKAVLSDTISIIEKKSCSISQTTETSKPFESVKIYYLDASNERTATTKDPNVGNAGDDTSQSLNKDDKTLSSSSIITEKKKESDNINDKSTTICKDSEVLSSIIEKQNNESDNKNEKSITGSKNNGSTSSSIIIVNQKNKSDNNIPSVNENESTGNLVKKVNKDGKETTKNEKDIKPVKPKQVNKDQLMAVYKKITDQQYRQNYMKTLENKVQDAPKLTDNLMTPGGLKTLLNKCTDTSKPLCPTLEVLPTNDKESCTDKVKSNEVNAEKYISNAVSRNLNNDKTNKIDTEDKISNEVTRNLNKDSALNERIVSANNAVLKESGEPANKIEINKISVNKTNETNNENCEKIAKTDLKDNKNEKLCGNCDNTNTETSFNITSKVKSAKYCLKCSSIFESETCSYCAKKSNLNPQSNQTQQPRKSNA